MNLPRPGKKKAYILAKAAERGRLTAQIEHEYKDVKFLADMIPFLPEKYKKNAVLWMKHIFERHLHRLPKMIAILGLTYIIKRLIDISEELRARLAVIKEKARPFEWIWKIAPLTGLPLVGLVPEEEVEPFEGMFPDWADWLIAFALAYIIVEHGGDIIKGLGEGVSGLTGLVGFLLG